jgi:hypothetical protein
MGLLPAHAKSGEEKDHPPAEVCYFLGAPLGLASSAFASSFDHLIVIHVGGERLIGVPAAAALRPLSAGRVPAPSRDEVRKRTSESRFRLLRL